MRVNWNRAAGITGHLILVCPVLFVACDSETKKGAAGGSRSGIESGSHVVTISTDRDLQRDLISITGTDSAASERRSEEHTSELQSRRNLVCRLLLEKKNIADTT